MFYDPPTRALPSLPTYNIVCGYSAYGVLRHSRLVAKRSVVVLPDADLLGGPLIDRRRREFRRAINAIFPEETLGVELSNAATLAALARRARRGACLVFWSGNEPTEKLMFMALAAALERIPTARLWRREVHKEGSGVHGLASYHSGQLRSPLRPTRRIGERCLRRLAAQWRDLVRRRDRLRLPDSSGAIVPVAESALDAILLRHADAKPLPMIRVAAGAMGETMDRFHISALFLCWRLCMMARNGLVSISGRPGSYRTLLVERTP